MANYCSSSFSIYSDNPENQKLLLKFYLRLKDRLESRECGRIREILANMFDWDEETLNDYDIDWRSSIEYVRLEMDRSTNKIQRIIIDTESAWSPRSHEIDLLTPEELDVVYIAEEPGCEIYINTDKEGRFYKDRVKVECYFPYSDSDTDEISEYYGEEEFDSLRSFIRDLSDFVIKDIKELEDPDIIKVIQEGFAAKYPDTKDEGFYIWIHAFSSHS